MGEAIKEEIERLDYEFQEEERNGSKKLAEEIAQMQANTNKEIEAQKIYLQNLFDVQCAKLRAEVETKIHELSANKYRNLPNIEDITNSCKIEQLPADMVAEIEKQLDVERAAFEKESKARRARFDAHMKRLVDAQETKRSEFLKRAIVPLVNALGSRKIADEAVLEMRYGIKITRNALRSGNSFVLYKAKMKAQDVVCLVTVLSQIPVDSRRNMDATIKCIRFLCETPMHEGFVKTYEIFSTGVKLYTFLDEHDPTTLGEKIYKQKQSDSQIIAWCIQICEAINHMHNYAIAHLNLKPENIIFNDKNCVKVIGLHRCYCFFNLDQEKFLKAPKADRHATLEFLPSECFTGDYVTRPVDVWCIGLILYECFTLKSPFKREGKKKQTKVNLTLDLNKIANQSQRELVDSMCSGWPGRPKLEEVIFKLKSYK